MWKEKIQQPSLASGIPLPGFERLSSASRDQGLSYHGGDVEELGIGHHEAVVQAVRIRHARPGQDRAADGFGQAKEVDEQQGE
jgi:hypothetical protein